MKPVFPYSISNTKLATATKCMAHAKKYLSISVFRFSNCNFHHSSKSRYNFTGIRYLRQIITFITNRDQHQAQQ